MRDMGYLEGTPCCITQEVLERVKKVFFNKYEMTMTDKQALWMCGFIVDDHNVSLFVQNQLYRHQTKPHMVSEGMVWHGWVRNEVDTVNPIDHKGRIRYTNKYHHMQPIYFSCETVTGDMITEDFVMNILDVGDEREYTRGLGREMRELKNPRKLKTVNMDDYEE